MAQMCANILANLTAPFLATHLANKPEVIYRLLRPPPVALPPLTAVALGPFISRPLLAESRRHFSSARIPLYAANGSVRFAPFNPRSK